MLREVVLGVALVAAGSGSACGSDDGSEESLPPFYLEAEMRGSDASRSIGTNIAGGAASAEPEIRVQEVRWLNLDRDRFRVEIEVIEPLQEAGTNIVAADGNSQFAYWSETNTYSKGPLFDIPEGVTMRIRPWSFGAMIGPWYGNARTLDEFMAELREMGGESSDVRIVGEGSVLGMATTIVEASPVSTSYSSETGESHHGMARYWVSLERMVILKQEVIDDPVQSFVIEVTRLEWSPKHRGGVAFEPPPGAVERDPNASSSDAITPSNKPAR